MFKNLKDLRSYNKVKNYHFERKCAVITMSGIDITNIF